MILRHGRYERIRFLVVRALEESTKTYEETVKNSGRDSLEVCVAEDAMDEWALLLEEVDASVTEDFKRRHGLVQKVLIG